MINPHLPEKQPFMSLFSLSYVYCCLLPRSWSYSDYDRQRLKMLTSSYEDGLEGLDGQPDLIVIWKGRVEQWPHLQLECINNPHVSQTFSSDRTCVWRLGSDTLPRRSAHSFDEIKKSILQKNLNDMKLIN